jgi:hypothetical protein
LFGFDTSKPFPNITGRSTMALFRKAIPSPASLASVVAKMRTRRDELTNQLEQLKTTVVERQEALEQTIIKGNSEDDLAKAESALGDAQRRVGALMSALSALDSEISEKEAEAIKLARQKAREEAAAAAKADLATFQSMASAFLEAARDPMPAAHQVGVTNWTARELEGLVRTLCAEVPIAVQRAEHEAQNHIAGLLDGSVRPPLAVPEVAPPQPEPIPTRTVFLLAPVRWRAGGRIEERNRHQKLDLPVAEADVALMKGYAVEPNDVRAKSTGAGYVVIPGGAAYADLNDPDLAPEQPVYGASDAAAVKGNMRVVLGGGN